MGSSGTAAYWQSPGAVIERLIFGTGDQGRIDALVDKFARRHLDAGLAQVPFRTTSTGVVYAVRLTDGRRVVIKAFAATPPLRLQATQSVQRRLFKAGFPCPEPLVGPAAIGDGVALAEALLDQGEVRDTHDPGCRRLMAEALMRHLDLTRNAVPEPAVPAGWDFAQASTLWPEQAHRPDIDLRGAPRGVEPIERLAAAAQRRAKDLHGARRRLVGHHDWSGKHFRFADGRVTAVYDWDSVMLGREAVIVGNAAMTHTANYDLPGVALAPTSDEVRAFVDDYSHARPTPLTRAEREDVAAAATYIGAYIARCELAGRHGEPVEPGSFTAAVLQYGDSYLQA